MKQTFFSFFFQALLAAAPLGAAAMQDYYNPNIKAADFESAEESRYVKTPLTDPLKNFVYELTGVYTSDSAVLEALTEGGLEMGPSSYLFISAQELEAGGALVTARVFSEEGEEPSEWKTIVSE